VKNKAVHNAMPSALERTTLDEPVVISELVLTVAVLFIFQFSLDDSKRQSINFARLNILQQGGIGTEGME